MEWKEFVLILFGGLIIVTFLFTAQSMFMISKLENVSITFKIEPDTLDFINKTQSKNYYENEVACIGNACSEGLLITEQIVACYNGCKFYNDNVVGQCMEYCEEFYERSK